MSDTAYWPYGATRSGGVTQTDRMYTSQRIEPGDSALGLYNYKARFYSTTLGQFLSPDDSARDGLNRLAYATRNPLRFNDPSGHCITIGGTTLSCLEQDALNWFECALTCGGWYGDLARGAMELPEFWWRVGVVYLRSDMRPVFQASLFTVIAKNATMSTLGVFSSSTASSSLAALFEVRPKLAPFFITSLSDILFGTNKVSYLSADAIVGAYEWWSAHWTWYLSTAQKLDGEISENMGNAGWALTWRSVTAAWELAATGVDVNAQLWSEFQRGFLSGLDELDVDPGRGDSFGPLDCLTDIPCWRWEYPR